MTIDSGSRPEGLALVTGASGGIGYEIADLLAARGHSLVLVARNEQRLRQRAEQITERHGVAVEVVRHDCAAPDAARALVAELESRSLDRVEVLVSNAGFGGLGSFAEQDPTTIDSMLRLNCGFLTALTRLVLPGMLQRGRGRILHVASTASFQPGPFMAVYYATKTYVLSFSEALSVELRDEGGGVTVTALCPGPTATGFQARAGMEQAAVFKGPLVRTARQAAESGVRGMLRGRRVVVDGPMNRLGTLAARWLPRALVLRAVARLQHTRRSAN